MARSHQQSTGKQTNKQTQNCSANNPQIPPWGKKESGRDDGENPPV